jgi:hypothetical protein
VDFRPKINTAILWDVSDTRGGIGQGKETKNVNVVDVASIQEQIQKS